MDNTARGLVAEFLVATALERLETFIPDQSRVEWDPYDFEAEIDDWKVSIEVKSSAYVQSWKQKEYSKLQFDIKPTRKWNPETGKYSSEPCRADIYIFCALVEKSICEHAAALNTDNWRFRVVPEEELPDQETIAWSQLGREAFGYEQLRQRIVEEARRRRPSQTLTESCSNIRAACVEEGYELELPERGGRTAWPIEDS